MNSTMFSLKSSLDGLQLAPATAPVGQINVPTIDGSSGPGIASGPNHVSVLDVATSRQSVHASSGSVSNELSVMLGDEEFFFTKEDLPDPPTVIWSNKISELFKDWHNSNRLVIRGRGIPVKYWPLFYSQKVKGARRVKPQAWEGIKAEWGKCKASRA